MSFVFVRTCRDCNFVPARRKRGDHFPRGRSWAQGIHRSTELQWSAPPGRAHRRKQTGEKLQTVQEHDAKHSRPARGMRRAKRKQWRKKRGTGAQSQIIQPQPVTHFFHAIECEYRLRMRPIENLPSVQNIGIIVPSQCPAKQSTKAPIENPRMVG